MNAKQQEYYNRFIKPSIVSELGSNVIYRENHSGLHDDTNNFYQQVTPNPLYTSWGNNYQYPIFIDDYGNAIRVQD